MPVFICFVLCQNESQTQIFGDSDKLYFITYAVVFWIDVFIRKEFKDILVDSWKYCLSNKGLEIYGWVIMPSHVHLIIGSSKNKLEDIVRDMKSHSSSALKKAIAEHLGESGKEWMIWMMERAGSENSNNKSWQFSEQHNIPIERLNTEMFDQKLGYIHNNPVVAGFAEKAQDWSYGSAGDFHGRKGLIELSYIV